MSNTESKLRGIWMQIDPYQPGSLRLDTEGPLEWYAGVRSSKQIEIAVVSDIKLNGLESSKSVTASCNLRKDGKYYISFLLTEMSEKDVFVSMCADIIDYASHGKNETDALTKVSYRYRQWKYLMAKKSLSILSDSERKGLIGELLFLNEMLDERKSLADILAGWAGPDGADQDFVYDECWTEVKTTDQASDKVEIHSFEQLGNQSDHGALRIYRVDACAPELEGAFTLRALVQKTKQRFMSDLDLAERFELKLSNIGYIDLENYDKYFYKYFSFDEYEVNETFPRLTREDASPEIVNCAYSISIPAISSWKKG